ncbi:ATPase assembly factor ATP10 [Sesbania bispinosa]|nr:ATPase assembly factor ATP10 [Sesbania bispinosa]
MLGLKRLIRRCSCLRDSIVASLHTTQPEKLHYSLPSHHLAHLTPKRFFLDFHQLGNRAAIEKERARLEDEMNRGYFADMAEFKQHGGKISVANKVIIPAMKAVKFPDFEVCFSDGKAMKLPFRLSDNVVDSDKSSVPKASFVCLSFRASSQV